MAGHQTHNPHGSGIRGLTNLRNIDGPPGAGKFGRLFKNLSPGKWSEDDLEKLAVAMTGTDLPKDGPDGEESDFASAYTYFGQFIDHDITFDPSTFQQQKSDPDGIVDFRTPRFDLDNVYGRGPADQPYLYDGSKLLLGEKLFLIERNPKARDLVRVSAASDGNQRAIIGDPRNDENVIVSQFQGMMQRFHNRMVDLNPASTFDQVQLEVRRHYQWAVVHDFLTKIILSDVLNKVSKAIVDPSLSFKTEPPDFKLYKDGDPIIPVEFSVAAYRLGHSMVRPGYRLNEFTTPLAIFDHNNPTNGLNAFGNFPKSWAIDWQRFIDLGLRKGPETDTDRVQKAYKIDTSIVKGLGELPFSVAGDEARTDPKKLNLAFRNLLRGQILLLPTGQEVAKAMGIKALDDKDIILFPANDGSTETQGEKSKDDAPRITGVSSAFARHCPLWTYILAESRRNFYLNRRAALGPVGGRIVAEVFLALLNFDEHSIVRNPTWKPMGGNLQFGLADILKTALDG